MLNESLNKSFFSNFALKSGIERPVRSLKKAYSGTQKLRETNKIGHHFSTYFQPVIAYDEVTQNVSSAMRHKVFCDELALFKKDNHGYEKDCYDEFAKQCLIQHIGTGEYSGTVRMILPQQKSDVLPILNIASQHITEQSLNPLNFDPKTTCEISRIAIPKQFRRRARDCFKGAATAQISTQSYSEIELRCFPMIAIGLYISCAALAKKEGRKHVYFMVEPRLAKSMRHIGIELEQIGDSFEYVGTRAPFYINYDNFVENLKPSFKHMFNEFVKKTH